MKELSGEGESHAAHSLSFSHHLMQPQPLSPGLGWYHSSAERREESYWGELFPYKIKQSAESRLQQNKWSSQHHGSGYVGGRSLEVNPGPLEGEVQTGQGKCLEYNLGRISYHRLTPPSLKNSITSRADSVALGGWGDHGAEFSPAKMRGVPQSIPGTGEVGSRDWSWGQNSPRNVKKDSWGCPSPPEFHFPWDEPRRICAWQKKGRNSNTATAEIRKRSHQKSEHRS